MQINGKKKRKVSKQIVSFEEFISMSRSFYRLTELHTQIIQAIVNDNNMLKKYLLSL